MWWLTRSYRAFYALIKSSEAILISRVSVSLPTLTMAMVQSQSSGVKFMYEVMFDSTDIDCSAALTRSILQCTMGMRGHEAQGCILADEVAVVFFSLGI